jgi:transcriptional regulator EpsA
VSGENLSLVAARKSLENPDVPAAPNGAADLDILQLVVDAALRVRSRHHFFRWSQGLLQSFVPHDILICSWPNGQAAPLRRDTFSVQPVSQQWVDDLCRTDAGVVPRLIQAWRESDYQPVVVERDSKGSRNAIEEGLARAQARNVAAHGVFSAGGRLEIFFSFVSLPEPIEPRQRFLIELIVPFLHIAWKRAQLSERAVQPPVANVVPQRTLTTREIEILRWIHEGKSNVEIGMILSISTLTVKNHVQKILRKLNVQNRTHAVARGVALNLLGIPSRLRPESSLERS